MQVLDLEEREDGSAVVTLDMKPYEMMYFIELGVIEAIKRGADETKKGIESRKDFESSREGDEHLQQTLNLQEPQDGLPEEK